MAADILSAVLGGFVSGVLGVVGTTVRLRKASAPWWPRGLSCRRLAQRIPCTRVQLATAAVLLEEGVKRR